MEGSKKPFKYPKLRYSGYTELHSIGARVRFVIQSFSDFRKVLQWVCHMLYNTLLGSEAESNTTANEYNTKGVESPK